MTLDLDETFLSQKQALYILGAGFSVRAGLPLAKELWAEVTKRAMPMTGRAEQFKSDLEDYIEFKKRSEGVSLAPESVNFEEFLGFLDIEHYLGLRGGDTWSDDGNESQVIVKTLIGQVLAERMPSKNDIPKIYLDFAKKLKPWDVVLTFNYDTLLEEACDLVGVPYRFTPNRYTRVMDGSGIVDMSDAAREEIVILKPHGSIDWYDKSSFLRQSSAFREQGLLDPPNDPIFNSPANYQVRPLIDGPWFKDGFKEIYRLTDYKNYYRHPAFFLSVPKIISPSTSKIVYSKQFGEIWRGMGRAGGHRFRLAVVGYSLPPHDEYAKQIIYRLITDYQDIPVERVDSRRTKDPFRIVDCCHGFVRRQNFKKRYRFIDWKRTQTYFEGFNDRFVSSL